VATALLAAAGAGERLGAATPKALVELAGRPMAAWSLLAFEAAETIDAAVIAAPPQSVTALARLAADVAPGLRAHVVPGGDSRSESVARALAETPEQVEVVAVHDAARPLVTAELLDRCVSQLEHWGCDGVVAAARAVDTIKEADAGGRVLATLERSRLWAVQTPQAFQARSLARAMADGDLERVSDDAQLVEAAGGDVRIVEAPRQNFKITTAHDLRVAASLLT
ncbi:MAG: 2-C-methyl-D-erythritol 4-phosphate cytidylyltransferase, partial [Solirubrobacterales bacterium]